VCEAQHSRGRPEEDLGLALHSSKSYQSQSLQKPITHRIILDRHFFTLPEKITPNRPRKSLGFALRGRDKYAQLNASFPYAYQYPFLATSLQARSSSGDSINQTALSVIVPDTRGQSDSVLAAKKNFIGPLRDSHDGARRFESPSAKLRQPSLPPRF
jgi:hypothetical protein